MQPPWIGSGPVSVGQGVCDGVGVWVTLRQPGPFGSGSQGYAHGVAVGVDGPALACSGLFVSDTDASTMPKATRSAAVTRSLWCCIRILRSRGQANAACLACQPLV